jgi:nucleoside 2-deoxyribosyltransferase
MTERTKICILGHFLVDVTFGTSEEEPKLRFGGIAHAARTAWALETPYILAYFAPEYLDEQILNFSSQYGNSTAIKIGNVLGCPNVVTIREPTEAGPQGYQFLLRDEGQSVINEDLLNEVCQRKDVTDFIIFPGGFDLPQVLKALNSSRAEVHVDANFKPDNPEEFASLGRKFSTIAFSTSSDIFMTRYMGSVSQLCKHLLGTYTNAFLFKENRGGSRFFSIMNPEFPFRIPAQPRHIKHSIGVGDCFDVAYVICRHKMEEKTALTYASCIAAEYACTTYPDDFADATKATMQIAEEEIIQLAGISLPWEERPQCQIYIAAPDFEGVDRGPIEQLDQSLRYHNFSSRRPVKEHGEMGIQADLQRRQALCDSDVSLMEQCRIMVAVLLYDDPGTLIEIGMAYKNGMPVIVYDPYRRANNLMLTQLPNLVSSNIDEVISAVFKYAAKELRS